MSKRNKQTGSAGRLGIPETDAGGYGRPPRQFRFKKGVSGNPSGRRKKTIPSLEDLLFAEVERPILVTDGLRKEKITTERLMYRRLILDAVKGNMRSMKEVFALMDMFERQRGSGNVGWNEIRFSWADEHRKMRELAKMGDEDDEETDD